VRSYTVVVVEDFEPFRRLICSVLQQRVDLQLVETSDGREAIQEIEKLQPDLVLLDVGLPKVNGIEVARRAREIAPATRILFLSMQLFPDLIREALALGARGYVHKPRVQSDLLPAIEAVLTGQRFVSPALLFDGAHSDAKRGQGQTSAVDHIGPRRQ